MTSVPVWVWFSSAMLAGVAGYLWWRVVAQTSERGTVWRWVGTSVFVLVAASAPVALIGQFLMPMGFQRVVGWPAWVGYGFVIFAGCVSVLLEPVRGIRWWLRRRNRIRAEVGDHQPVGDTPDHTTPHPDEATALRAGAGSAVPQDSVVPMESADTRGAEDRREDLATTTAPPPTGLSRRFVFERILAGSILTAGAALTGVGIAGALGEPRVRRQTIAIRSLPDEAIGLRIALISDLHVGSLTRRDDVRRIVDLVNAQNADIICLAGDFSDGDAQTLGSDLEPLADLRSTAGTYFVTGNHEFYFDVSGWLEFFPTVGVQVLANQNVDIRGVMLAGTHDIQGEAEGLGPDVPTALSGRRADQPVILLSHNPVVLDDAIDNNVDLVLAGHTHGGQFIPGVWFVGATTRTLSGYYSFGDTQVFVTNGCRFWGPVARIAAPIEIVMIELAKA